MIILAEKKRKKEGLPNWKTISKAQLLNFFRKGVVKYPNPPEPLMRNEYLLYTELAEERPDLEGLYRGDAVQVVQIICAIATVHPRNKRLSSDDLYYEYKAGLFNKALYMGRKSVVVDTDQALKAFDCCETAGTLANLGF